MSDSKKDYGFLKGKGCCYNCSTPEYRISRMILCPICGNKRCQKATDHNLECTGSNEPGQPGSRYPLSNITTGYLQKEGDMDNLPETTTATNTQFIEELRKIENKLVSQSEPLGAEFEKVWYEHADDLYEE